MAVKPSAPIKVPHRGVYGDICTATPDIAIHWRSTRKDAWHNLKLFANSQTRSGHSCLVFYPSSRRRTRCPISKSSDSGCCAHHFGILLVAGRHLQEFMLTTSVVVTPPHSSLLFPVLSVTLKTLIVSLHRHNAQFNSNYYSARNCKPWNLLHSSSWRFTPAESLARSLPWTPPFSLWYPPPDK
jgi:hypothetical protein